MANYGLPYQGSKNKLIKKLAPYFPNADNFYDLFGGGGSVSHYMAKHGEYKVVHYNELDSKVVDLFIHACSGFYNYNRFKPKWIDRDTFFRLKDRHPYIKYLWSFGNGGGSYLFGVKIEEDKHSMHNAVVFDVFDSRFINLFNFSVWPINIVTVKEKRLYIRKVIREKTGGRADLKQLEQLERLDQLQQLQRLDQLEQLEQLLQLEQLEITSLDYQDVKIKDNSIIYCDVPYNNTKGYSGSSFDRDRFLLWAKNNKTPVYISEYDIEGLDFTLVAEFKFKTTMTSKGSLKRIERLYCNDAGAKLLKSQCKGK